MNYLELQQYLSEQQQISSEVWQSFIDAYDYDAATPMHWLIGNLQIIYNRLASSETILVENDNIVLNLANYEEILKEYFPTIKFNEIVNNN